MLKVIIDTNIIISSLWGGNPKEIINLWQKNLIILICSEKIIKEYLNVLSRFKIEENINNWSNEFFNKSVIVVPKKEITIIKDDPTDNIFIEAAITGKADYIISGDKHLLKIRKYKKTKIINAATFLKIIFP